MEEGMGQEVAKPTYTGMDKYPGIISTVLTFVVAGVFLGALYISATSHHGDHGEPAEQSAPATEKSNAAQ